MFKGLSEELKGIKESVTALGDTEATDLIVEIQNTEREKLPLVLSFYIIHIFHLFSIHLANFIS